LERRERSVVAAGEAKLGRNYEPPGIDDKGAKGKGDERKEAWGEGEAGNKNGRNRLEYPHLFLCFKWVVHRNSQGYSQVCNSRRRQPRGARAQ
jgi:hypothetical protein